MRLVWDPVAAGDLVSGLGTVIIDPPEGDMADYLASLDRLLDQKPGAWLAGEISAQSLAQALQVGPLQAGTSFAEGIGLVYD